MIRFLAAILLMVTFHSMEPMASAAAPAVPHATVIGEPLPSAMPNGPMSRCAGGHPCVPGCSACNLVGSNQTQNALLAISVADIRANTLAGFDLSWRLYRPPKDRA